MSGHTYVHAGGYTEPFGEVCMHSLVLESKMGLLFFFAVPGHIYYRLLHYYDEYRPCISYCLWKSAASSVEQISSSDICAACPCLA